MEVLFWPLFCHLNSYNANGARVTSGGIPALCVCVCVCVCVYVKKCVRVSKTECLCPFYSLQTRYSTEPRITMLLLWKTKNNNKKKISPKHTHTHTCSTLVSCSWQVEKLQSVSADKLNNRSVLLLLLPPLSLLCLLLSSDVSFHLPAKFLGRAFWQNLSLLPCLCVCENNLLMPVYLS